jgi:hypothetical protein
LAEAVERLIESGAAGDFENIVAAGIVTLSEPRDPEFDAWIEREIAPVMEELDRHPERTVSSEEAWSRLEAHIAMRRGTSSV